MRWAEIVGADIAALCEPIKIQWAGRRGISASAIVTAEQTSGTLVLRVEGPASIEIQHLAGVICERVNRFFGWRAVARIALRQAPLGRPVGRSAVSVDTGAVDRIAAEMPEIKDDGLLQALARLGAAIKRGSGERIT